MEKERAAYADLMRLTFDVMKLASGCHQTLKQMNSELDTLQRVQAISPQAHKVLAQTVQRQMNAIQEKFTWVTKKYPNLNPNKR